MTGDEALGMSGPSLAEHSLPAGDDLIGVTEVDLFGGQHRDAAMAFESASGGRILTPGRRASVLIGECTSDNGVHVHRNAISMCAPALPYVAVCLTVAARPPERRRRSGAFGRRRERPPLSGCLDRHRGGLACAHPCHPPPGVAPLQQSLAGRPSSAAASAAYQRIRPPVTAFHQLGGSASRPSEVGVGARPSPKLPRGG